MEDQGNTKASLSVTFHVTVSDTTGHENFDVKHLSMDSFVSLFHKLAVAFNSYVLL